MTRVGRRTGRLYALQATKPISSACTEREAKSPLRIPMHQHRHSHFMQASRDVRNIKFVRVSKFNLSSRNPQAHSTDLIYTQYQSSQYRHNPRGEVNGRPTKPKFALNSRGATCTTSASSLPETRHRPSLGSACLARPSAALVNGHTLGRNVMVGRKQKSNSYSINFEVGV